MLKLYWTKCPIMTDRKQGAGLSSGSSEAVHKVNYLSENQFLPSEE